MFWLRLQQPESERDDKRKQKPIEKKNPTKIKQVFFCWFTLSVGLWYVCFWYAMPLIRWHLACICIFFVDLLLGLFALFLFLVCEYFVHLFLHRVQALVIFIPHTSHFSLDFIERLLLPVDLYYWHIVHSVFFLYLHPCCMISQTYYIISTLMLPKCRYILELPINYLCKSRVQTEVRLKNTLLPQQFTYIFFVYLPIRSSLYSMPLLPSSMTSHCFLATHQLSYFFVVAVVAALARPGIP